MLPAFSDRSESPLPLPSLACSLLALGLIAGACPAQKGAVDGDWPVHGGDAGMTRYSSLEQITAGNVARLAPAWQWVTADAPYMAEHANLRATNFEATPLEIDGVLYLTTGLQQAAAIDAVTGKTLWSYNPGAFETSERATGGLRFINRGMAYWPGTADSVGTQSSTPRSEELPRLFYATRDATLIALDLKNGEPIGSFGAQGQVDTTVGIPRLNSKRDFGNSSAPIVVGDVVVLGNRVSDAASRREMPPGYIRGYDVRTGEQLWEFHSVPLAGEPGNETWGDDSWQRAGNTNAWGLISADPELGYVYLPFGTPTNDFYGGDRPGDNLYAESLVCLDAETGDIVWYFQAVHHGLWDYDLPAPPVLFDHRQDGKVTRALALVSKHGFTFVFDRTDGRPLWPIEERPVPQSTVPGEQTAATQPFPTKPPPFERLGITVDDLIDFTPELRKEAIEILERYEYGPIFTPPSMKGTLLLPSYGGGANWPGAAIDPDTNMLYVPSMTRPLVMQIVEPDPSRSEFRYVRGGETSVEGPRGLPLIKPPYGRVTAIDLNEGEIRWMVPNGGDGPIDHEAIAHLKLEPMGTPTRGGVLVTKTLLFVTEGSGRTGSATGGGNFFRALDKATGNELWRYDLGGHATGVPMTYEAGGRQFVAVAVGSDPPRLVSFALPEGSDHD